jgi:hypothetical protein
MYFLGTDFSQLFFVMVCFVAQGGEGKGGQRCRGRRTCCRQLKRLEAETAIDHDRAAGLLLCRMFYDRNLMLLSLRVCWP